MRTRDGRPLRTRESVRSVEDNAQLASLAKMRVMADRQQEDATKNPQRVIDRKFSRSSIGQQLLVRTPTVHARTAHALCTVHALQEMHSWVRGGGGGGFGSAGVVRLVAALVG